MLSVLKSLFQSAPTTPVDAVRAYLNASVSVADLERRQREVERGLFPVAL